MDDFDMKNSVTIRFYAAARSAAGKSEILVVPGKLGVILAQLAVDNVRLAQVFEQCSFLLDGIVMHEKNVEGPSGCTLDVLPPFAGG